MAWEKDGYGQIGHIFQFKLKRTKKPSQAAAVWEADDMGDFETWGVVPSGYRSSNTIAATEKKWLWGAVDSLSLEARGRCLYWTSYQIKYVVVVSIYDAVDLKKAYRRVVTFFLSTHSTFTISSSRRFAHKSHHWTERSLDLSRNMDPRAIF